MASLAVLPVCDLNFDCGCGWPGAGAYAHCDIHTPGPPDCPWCDHPVFFVLAALFGYGLALAAALGSASRTGFLSCVGITVVVLLAALMLAGIVTSLLLGRPPLAGW